MLPDLVIPAFRLALRYMNAAPSRDIGRSPYRPGNSQERGRWWRQYRHIFENPERSLQSLSIPVRDHENRQEPDKDPDQGDHSAGNPVIRRVEISKAKLDDRVDAQGGKKGN